MANRINFIKECKLYDFAEIEGLISKVEIKQKQNKENFLMVTIVDSDSELTFPIWDNVDARYERMNIGQILTVLGTVSEYDGNRQIKVSNLSIRDITPEERSKFIPSYDIRKEDIEYFLKMVNQLKEPYKTIVTEAIGINDATKWNAFLTAPAAVRHHHNKLGGLFIHTYGVSLAAANMISNYTEYPFAINANNVINRDRVIAAAMLHDICKREEYTYDLAIGYGNSRFDHRLKFIPYIEIINGNLKMQNKPHLSEEELELFQELVLTHHGPWGGYKPKHIEGVIVFLADMVDSQIVGCAESQDPRVRMTISSMMDAE